MFVTVAICTWNRATLLKQTLEQMTYLHIPDGVQWELIVVNNNCTDDTAGVIDSYLDRLPVRNLFEPKQGHSYARNCAIEQTQGDLLIWTDDDVLVDPNWLAEYVLAAQRWPQAGIFGGPVEAWLETAPPKWLERNWDFIKGLFVIREFYEDEFPCPQEVTPVGANMAARMEWAKRIRFDENTGRVGATLSGGDDCDWLTRLAAEGAKCAWVGHAKVRHFIPKERLTESFLRKWFEGAGRTSVRINGVTEAKTINGVPRWIWRKYLNAYVCERLLRISKTPAWLQMFRSKHMLRGMIDEISENKQFQSNCNE